MKKYFSTMILIIVFLVGLSVLLYPAFSSWWNSRAQSRAIATYQELAAEMEEEDYEELFAQADAYNAALAERKGAHPRFGETGDYEEILDVTGTGIIGYIKIPRIHVRLPVYHGTDEGVLQVAAGHLEGTSFPVGGKSTHSVISAHCGLPSARLFTDLDQLETGDTFTITVLNRLMTYEVDRIRTVKPKETSALEIAEGQDYVTLLTCTPYGINTHRLLVRGHRIANLPETREETAADVQDPGLLLRAAAVTAAAILLILLTVLLMRYRKRR